MIGTIDIELSACKPNMPLQPVCAFVNSPQSIRIRNVPRSIGKWNISRVYIGVLYPDNTTINLDCVKEGGVYVCTFAGSTLAGTVKDGLTVYADGKDENNQTITGYVLGVGDIYILSSDGTVVHGGSTVHFYLEEPSNPVIGDMYNDNGVVKTYNGTEWIKPLSKTSDLVNDSGFITSSALPTKTSDLTNDSGFITSSALPTKVSQLENDSMFLSYAGGNVHVPSTLDVGIDGEGRVSVGRDFGDIKIGVEGGGDGYINIHGGAFESGYITIGEKTVATTDQIPTVNNPTITLTQGGVTKGTFTLNQSTSKTIDLDAGGGCDNTGYFVYIKSGVSVFSQINIVYTDGTEVPYTNATLYKNVAALKTTSDNYSYSFIFGSGIIQYTENGKDYIGYISSGDNLAFYDTKTIYLCSNLYVTAIQRDHA